MNTVSIKPELIRWARERSGITMTETNNCKFNIANLRREILRLIKEMSLRNDCSILR